MPPLSNHHSAEAVGAGETVRSSAGPSPSHHTTAMPSAGSAASVHPSGDNKSTADTKRKVRRVAKKSVAASKLKPVSVVASFVREVWLDAEVNIYGARYDDEHLDEKYSSKDPDGLCALALKIFHSFLRSSRRTLLMAIPVCFERLRRN